MKLLKATLWVEVNRLKIQLILLAVIIVMVIIALGISPSADFIVTLNIDNDSSVDFNDLNVAPEVLFSLIPVFLTLALAIVTGFIIFMTIPFRGSTEWQEGQFHLLRMCHWNQYQIQACRAGFFLAICLLFCFAITVIGAIGLQSKTNEIPGMVSDFILVFQMSALTIVPLIVGLGMLFTAVRTAFYLRGLTAVITILQVIGVVAALQFIGMVFVNTEGLLFPSIGLSSIAGATGERIALEPTLFAWLMAIGLVALSARIFEEAEA